MMYKCICFAILNLQSLVFAAQEIEILGVDLKSRTLHLIDGNQSKHVLYSGDVSRNTIGFLNNRYPYFNLFNKDVQFYYADQNRLLKKLVDYTIALVQSSIINDPDLVVVDSTDEHFVDESHTEFWKFILDPQRGVKIASICIYGIDSASVYWHVDESQKNKGELITSWYKHRDNNSNEAVYLYSLDIQTERLFCFDTIFQCDVPEPDCPVALLKSMKFENASVVSYPELRRVSDHYAIDLYHFDWRTKKRKRKECIKVPITDFEFLLYQRFEKKHYLLTENKLYRCDRAGACSIQVTNPSMKFFDFRIF